MAESVEESISTGVIESAGAWDDLEVEVTRQYEGEPDEVEDDSVKARWYMSNLHPPGVSGYITDYSGFRYALFFLAEYINMATVSSVATTLFLGGYRLPWPLNQIEFLNNPWFGPFVFMIKVQVLIFCFSWVRAAVPVECSGGVLSGS